MKTLIFHEGFWSLGKSYDIAHSRDKGHISFPIDFNRSLGEARFFVHRFAIEFAKLGNFEEGTVFDFDRTPFWMLTLSKFQIFPPRYLFLGKVESRSLNSERIGYCLREFVEAVKEFTSAGNKVIFKIYIPANVEKYSGFLSTSFSNLKWKQSKLIDPGLLLKTRAETFYRHANTYLVDTITANFQGCDNIEIVTKTSEVF